LDYASVIMMFLDVLDALCYRDLCTNCASLCPSESLSRLEASSNTMQQIAACTATHYNTLQRAAVHRSQACENGGNRILWRMISAAAKGECEPKTNWVDPAPMRMVG